MDDAILSGKRNYALLSRCGVELEYMLVSRETLDIEPAADRLLDPVLLNIKELKDVDISNELVNHVLELKTDPPFSTPWAGRAVMSEALKQMSRVLEQNGLGLLGTGMHPWMDPRRETKLWPLDNAEIYQWYDRVFDCSRHGFANLQSIHLNIPFATDEEFLRLHSAIRFILPLIPGLCASSPVTDGKWSGKLDNRLSVYRENQKQYPEISGRVIPDSFRNENEYRKRILDPLEKLSESLGGKDLIESQWLNSRGAIARFDRKSIEIRLMDKQECLDADLSCAELVFRAVKFLTNEHRNSINALSQMPTDDLASILWTASRDGDRAVITDETYLRLIGLEDGTISVNEIWDYFRSRTGSYPTETDAFFKRYREKGCLARRIMKQLNTDFRKRSLSECYRKLLDCETKNRVLE